MTSRTIKAEVAKPQLITVKDALSRGYRRTRLYRLINEGRIIAYKDGRSTKIDATSIDQYESSLPRLQPRKLHPEPAQ
jgi:excisionase family DNA binding protein